MITSFLLILSIAAHAQNPCAKLFQTDEARAYQAQARRIIDADLGAEQPVGYVGVSPAQVLELVNEGVIEADRWGRVPISFLPVADHPAVIEFERRNAGVRIDWAERRLQFTLARDEAWCRAVIERMEPRHPNIRTRGFFGFLSHLRPDLERSKVPNPTLRQIMEATTWETLPKARVKTNPEFRTLVKLLGLPWATSRMVGESQRHRHVVDAFRNLPREAGFVVAFGPSVLNRVHWRESGLAELKRIELDHVTDIQAFSDEDQDVLDRLAE